MPLFKEAQTESHHWIINILSFIIGVSVFAISVFVVVKYMGWITSVHLWKYPGILAFLSVILAILICAIPLPAGIASGFVAPKILNVLFSSIISKRYQLKSRLPLPGQDRSLVQKYVNELLQNGRKTIATIVSVEYQKIEEKYLETGILQQEGAADQYCYYYHRSPLFKITYKFNPPDDEKAEDLVHHIYTHLPPDNHFKAGAPLPILYRIYKNEDDLEIVDSMPYPLPIDDIGDLSNAVYHISREDRRNEETRRIRICQKVRNHQARMQELAEERSKLQNFDNSKNSQQAYYESVQKTKFEQNNDRYINQMSGKSKNYR